MGKRRYKLSIKGKTWRVILYTKRTFARYHGDDYATTDPTLRTIYFQDGHLSLPIIRHEVRHAFMAENCLNDDTLSTIELEEVQCCLDERHWDDMDRASREIFKSLSHS